MYLCSVCNMCTANCYMMMMMMMMMIASIIYLATLTQHHTGPDIAL